MCVPPAHKQETPYMNSIQTLLAMLLCVSCVGLLNGCEDRSGTATTAQPSHHAGSNAADEYRSLHAAMPEQLRTALRDSRGNLTPQVQRMLPSNQALIDRLVWATRLEHCNWEIDYTPGLDTLLPHLGYIRDFTRLLQVDARRSADAGDPDTAAENTAALLRMTRHIGGQTAIEALVGFALLRVASDIVIDYQHQWSSAHRRMLLEEIQRIDRRDPLGGEAMLDNDRHVSRQAGDHGPDEDRFRESQTEVIEGLDEAIRLLRS
jgi:hypothetical protein